MDWSFLSDCVFGVVVCVGGVVCVLCPLSVFFVVCFRLLSFQCDVVIMCVRSQFHVQEARVGVKVLAMKTFVFGFAALSLPCFGSAVEANPVNKVVQSRGVCIWSVPGMRFL